ncbi:hypothetical protein BDR04DRAFT_1147753 [Suillus decipiens]|nr:hypothetical protein BDR04DRAFT_1147753 [Suillus decipiens]
MTTYLLIPTSLTLPDPSAEEDTSKEFISHAFEEAAEQMALLDVFQDSTIGDDDEDENMSSVGEPEFIITWELPEKLQTDSFKFPHPEENPIIPAKGTTLTCM